METELYRKAGLTKHSLPDFKHFNPDTIKNRDIYSDNVSAINHRKIAETIRLVTVLVVTSLKKNELKFLLQLPPLSSRRN